VKEDRHWRAEQLVRTKLETTSAFTKAVKQVEKEMARIEKKIVVPVPMKGKK